MIKICEYCKKEFNCKMKHAKYCSLNCRVKANYHKNHKNAKYNIMGRTEEEKKKLNADYQRKKYKEDKVFREKQKERRRNYYKKYGK